MTSALRMGKMARSLSTNALAVRSSTLRGKQTRRASTSVIVAALRDAERHPAATTATVFSAASVVVTGPARAEETAAVDTAVDVVVEVVRATGDAIKQGLGLAQQGFEAAGDAYQQVAPTVQSVTDVVAPAVKSAVQAATPVVEAGVRAASGAATSVVPTLERAVTSAGVDSKTLETAERAAETAVTTTKPVFESIFTFLTTSSPTVLAETALGFVAAYYLLPPVLKAAGGALRGYAGDVSPPAALDALSSRGNAVLVDIRSAKDKESQGVPDLPNASRLIELEFAFIEDRRVRGQLRDIGGLETKITAMQLAALKRLNKGTTIYLLDRNGGVAKAVARDLAARGFKKVFVVSGGFAGWAKDRLGTRLARTVSRVEVLLPGSTFRGGSGATRGIVSGSRQLPAPTRRALPSGTSSGR